LDKNQDNIIAWCGPISGTCQVVVYNRPDYNLQSRNAFECFGEGGETVVTGLVIHDQEMDFNVLGSVGDAAVTGLVIHD
jgi:hypothetical protein